MKRRPWFLILLAAFHGVAPIGNMFFNAQLAGVPFWEYTLLFFEPENFSRQWPHLFLPVIAGLAIYACKKWSFWIYLFAMMALFGVSYLGYLERADKISVIPLIIVYCLNIFIVGYFLIPTVRKVYFDPRLRWWESQPRYACSIPAVIQDQEQEFSGQVANFSQGGVFLKPDYLPKDNSEIHISFDYNAKTYSFSGIVIHHGRQRASGFGVKFSLTPEQKVNAQDLADIFKSEGKLLKSRRLQEQDSFLFWIKKLLKTGKGFLPEIIKRS